MPADPTEANLQVAEKVAALAAQSRIPLLVIGAVALAAHGYVRFTEDIDLGVDADLAQMRTLAQLLEAEGYHVEFHEPDAEDPLGGVIDVSGDFGLVQIVNFGDRFPAAIRDALLGDDVRVRAGSQLRVMPIPQLVALKMYAGGLKSHADILELLRRNPGLDLEIIRATCRKYRQRGIDGILAALDNS